MTLLDKLKSWLGLEDSDREAEPARDVGVTVEREGAAPSAESEAAVKGTETPGTGTESETDAEPVEASEDAPAEEEPEEEPAEEEPEEEPADEEPEGELDEKEPPEEVAEEEPAEAAEEPGASIDVTDIKGIGPAYADRLAAAGIENVADLAAADAEDLAEKTDISATRIENWIEQAKVR